MENLIAALGDEIQDVDEELFDLFTQHQSYQDLGMIDSKVEVIELSIAGRDFTVKQSPGVLKSNRGGGTTGAAVWRACVRFAEWLASPNSVLFEHTVLDSSSIVLELGSGISGLVPFALSPKVGQVIATDQQYALKLLRENVHANTANIKPKVYERNGTKVHSKANNIDVVPLDWETDDIDSLLRTNGLTTGVDAVLACDCIFNYALIEPLVQACVDICKARTSLQQGQEAMTTPSMCVVAQQLRQPEVFEQWLHTFTTAFHTWRVPDNMLSEGLKEGSGYVIHIGILRKDVV